MESFTSTVHRNGRLYTTIKRVNLFASTRKPARKSGCSSWLGSVHASPLWADGKLFVPMFDGRISVVVDEGDSATILGKTTLDGACLAAPSAAHGRVFVPNQKRLYCFGSDLPAPAFVAKPQEELKHESTEPSAGPPASLQVVPSEFALKSGTSQAFKVYALDRTGRRIEEVKEGLAWENGSPNCQSSIHGRC